MDLKYHNWLNIEVTHNYFVEDVCSIIDFAPFKDTTTISKNYNILIQKKSNTTSFFIGNRNTQITSEDFHAIEPLYFQIISENNHFHNFTNINPTEHTILNFQTTPQNINTGRLQNGTYVSTENLISFKPPHFNISIPNKEVHLEIKTSQGNSILTQTIDGQKVSNYSVNLTNQDTAIYQIWVDNIEQESFLLISGGLHENCIGILCIDPLELLKSNNETTLQLNFQTRSTYRKYQIIVSNKRKITVSSISIKGISDEKYTGPEETPIINGQIAQVFTSSTPIPLQKEPVSHPQLNINYTNQFSNRNNELEILLPNPNVETLKPYHSDKDSISYCSTNIVYV
jgi:hypothetical protein